MLDLAPWLVPLDGANPSGGDLRDDPRFHALEQLMQPRIDVVRDPRNNNPVSQTLVPVDWSAVLAEAEELRTRGRDLRLLVIVARALANEQGLEGLTDGLTLIARTIEAHWETLHPELRPASNPRDAALRRINALLQLQDPWDGLLGDLGKMAVLTARGLGAVSGGELARGSLDTRAALNERTRGLGEKERTALTATVTAEHEQLVTRVRAACLAQAESAPAEMAALAAGARAAAEAFAAVEAALAVRIGVDGQLVEFQPLRTFLGQMRTTLEHALAPAPEAERDPAPATFEAPPTIGGADAVPGRIATREEVVACLDRIIDFYDRTEPASPVPFLARRMRRMVPMDFLQLMEDLAPSGLKEFRALAGLEDDKKAASRNSG